jgi:fatty acid desaturase
MQHEPAAEPLWYRVQLERQTLKDLRRRTNSHGLFFFGSYLLLMAVFATFSILDVVPVGARVVCFVLFANVYCFGEAILHETHHRTPFRSSWLNEAVHYFVAILMLKEPVRDRWLHAAHHTYTSYPDLDPELFLEPPPHMRYLVMDFFRVRFVFVWLYSTLRNAVGPDALTRRFVPPGEHAKVKWSSRACLGIYLAGIGLAVALHAWWPLLAMFVARFVGSVLLSWTTLTQHAGLVEGAPDWRQNTRTVLMGPVNRLLVWNMGFHVEHHMNPTVPFHALPRLHEAMSSDCPAPYRSTWAAWREMVPALWRQRHEPTYFVRRPLPGPARVPDSGAMAPAPS